MTFPDADRQVVPTCLASALSRDSRLAYAWYLGGNPGRGGEPRTQARGVELRVIDTTQPRSARPTVVFADDDVAGIKPFGATPDGRSIVAALVGKDRVVHLALVIVAERRFRSVKSIADLQVSGQTGQLDSFRDYINLALSHDGRYLAYDVRTGQSPERDIFIVDVESGRESAAVVQAGDDRLMGWRPDAARSCSRTTAPLLPPRSGRARFGTARRTVMPCWSGATWVRSFRSA
jgi:hypothetical protein